MEESVNWDSMSPVEKLESARGRYLIASALHYGAQQIERFPEERAAERDCEDMRAILEGCFPQYAAQFRQNDRRWAAIHRPKAVDLGSGEGGEEEGEG